MNLTRGDLALRLKGRRRPRGQRSEKSAAHAGWCGRGGAISDRTAAHRVQAGRAGLTDTFASGRESPFMKAGCGKTARPVCAADGGQRKSNRARLLRPDSEEATVMVVERRGRVI